MPKVIRLSCWTNLSIIHFCLSGIIFKTLVFFVDMDEDDDNFN